MTPDPHGEQVAGGHAEIEMPHASMRDYAIGFLLSVVLTAIPFMAILLVKIYGFLKWMVQDYGSMPAHLIEEEATRLAGEEPHAEPQPVAAAAPAQ